MSFGKTLCEEIIMNNYHFIECIETGTYGEVYKVLNKNNNTYYAAKKIHQFNIKLLEKQLHKTLHHDNIIKYYDIFHYQGSTYIITELAKMDLYMKYYTLNKNITFKEIFKILIDIANAIQYMHHNDIVHGDIKIENVLICENEIYKLCDFGLSFKCKNMKKCPYNYKELVIPEIKKQLWGKPSDVWCFGKMIKKILLFYAFPKRHCITTFGATYYFLQIISEMCMDPDYKQRLTIDDILIHLNAKKV